MTLGQAKDKVISELLEVLYSGDILESYVNEEPEPADSDVVLMRAAHATMISELERRIA